MLVTSKLVILKKMPSYPLQVTSVLKNTYPLAKFKAMLYNKNVLNKDLSRSF